MKKRVLTAAALGGLALFLAGCTIPSYGGPGYTAPAGPAAPAPAQTGDRLVSFDIVTSAYTRHFQKTGPDTWTGALPTTGQVVQWSARADELSVVLYTETPQFTTIVLYVDTREVSSPALDPALNPRPTNLVFQ